MTRVAQMSTLLLALVAGGCRDGQQGIEFREDPATLALAHLGQHIRAGHPTERIAVYGDRYCGFPEECPASGGASAWASAVLDGAARELRSNIVRGRLRHALIASTADLVVTFGPIRTFGADSLELVVRYERMKSARITRVSMTRTGAAWRVAAERIISTATYADLREIL